MSCHNFAKACNQKTYITLIIRKHSLSRAFITTIAIMFSPWSVSSVTFPPPPHELINYIDTKDKCRHLKKQPVKGLCGRYLSV